MGVIIGIDPGQNGAVAFLDIQTMDLEVFPMPTFDITVNKKNKKFYDFKTLARLYEEREDEIIRAYVEEVSAMPHDAPASAFTFGTGFGIILCSLGLSDHAFELVRPAAWKKVLKVKADKDEARKKASQLMPKCAHMWSRKSEDGLAEASLIALYGLGDMGYPVTGPIKILERD